MKSRSYRGKVLDYLTRPLSRPCHVCGAENSEGFTAGRWYCDEHYLGDWNGWSLPTHGWPPVFPKPPQTARFEKK